VAAGLSQGGREYQEDAIVTDFPFGMDSGVAVLADGMGGHEAGDVASKIVVTQVYAELKFHSAAIADDEAQIPATLTQAAANANARINAYVKEVPAAKGMGATLVSLVMVENRMYWMSIGDSPLFLLRDGKLSQLNEDHSLAPQIDFMVEQGLIDANAAKNHPDRNCLTSVVMGSRIAKSDCPAKPFELRMGDIIVVSSDGLQYLDNDKIERVLYRYRRRKSAEIAGHLLEAVAELGDPDQDNVSFSVIKLNHMKPVERKIKPKPIGEQVDAGQAVTRIVTLEKDPLPDPKSDNASGANAEDMKKAVGAD
jgi:serine/threonine protein phosphatase PrpC